MPRATKTRTMYEATETFFSAYGDAQRGDRFAEGHEMVKQNPQYFQRVQGEGVPLVEAATAAPGEARGDDA